MVSNALSSRRELLRRPIICIPSPPAPLPDIDCWVEPIHELVMVDELVALTFYGDHANYEMGQALSLAVSVTGGTVEYPSTIYDEQEAFGTWYAPDTPGFYELTALFTWPDSSKCLAFGSITVEPPP